MFPVFEWSDFKFPLYYFNIMLCTKQASAYLVPKYSGDLKSKHIWIWNGLKEDDGLFVLILNGICNSYEWFYVFRNHLKSRPKYLDSEWSRFQIAQPFEILPSKSLEFKCFQILNGRILDHRPTNIIIFQF